MKKIICGVALACLVSCGASRHETISVRGTLEIWSRTGATTGRWRATPGRVRVLSAKTGAIVSTVKTARTGEFVIAVPKGTYVFKGSPEGYGYGFNCVRPPISVTGPSIPEVMVPCNT